MSSVFQLAREIGLDEAVSGAQPSNVFLSALLKSFEEWKTSAR
ncbi:hypothetical protein [Candidatus Pollutiaquabacter sp.]